MTAINMAFLFICAVLAAEPAEPPKSGPLLADGVIVSQVPGTAARDDRSEGWRFTTAQALTAGEVELPAGHALRLLPCRGLEMVTAFAGDKDTADVRLTGIVTEYDGMNFLFILDAVPVLQRTAAPQEQATPPPARLVTDPNETLGMPEDIFAKLRVERKTDFTKAADMPVLPADRMLVNRTGFFRQDKGQFLFEVNGFGLGAASKTCRLLPNQHRQEAQRRQQSAFGKHRYTVTAIETVYEGQTWLLLQRVLPAWSYGNFTP